jgi:hypothetical protein
MLIFIIECISGTCSVIHFFSKHTQNVFSKWKQLWSWATLFTKYERLLWHLQTLIIIFTAIFDVCYYFVLLLIMTKTSLTVSEGPLLTWSYGSFTYIVVVSLISCILCENLPQAIDQRSHTTLYRVHILHVAIELI